MSRELDPSRARGRPLGRAGGQPPRLTRDPRHGSLWFTRLFTYRCDASEPKILPASDVGMDRWTVCLRSRSEKELPSAKSKSSPVSAGEHGSPPRLICRQSKIELKVWCRVDEVGVLEVASLCHVGLDRASGTIAGGSRTTPPELAVPSYDTRTPQHIETAPPHGRVQCHPAAVSSSARSLVLLGSRVIRVSALTSPPFHVRPSVLAPDGSNSSSTR